MNVGAGGVCQSTERAIPLQLDATDLEPERDRDDRYETPNVDGERDDEQPFTIAEAKRRLARSLGVDPSAIKITVEA